MEGCLLNAANVWMNWLDECVVAFRDYVNF